MGTKPRNLAQIAQQAEEAAAEQGIDLQTMLDGEDLNPALERIYGELGGDAMERVQVYVYKVMEKDGKEPRIWQGVPGDYDLYALGKRFGSGDYRVKVMGPLPTGKMVLQANQVIPIMLDPIEDQRLEAMRRGELVAPSLGGGQSTLTPEKIAEIVAAAVKAAQPPVAPAPDPFVLFGKMTEAMRNLLPQNAGGGMGAVRDVMEAAKMIVDLRGPSSDAKPKDHALNKGIDLVIGMLAKHAQQPPVLAQGQPIAQTSTSAPEVVSRQEITMDDAAALEVVKGHLRNLCEQAAKGTDALKVAEFIYEDVPDAMIAEMATNPEWFKIFTANVPECAQYSEWFFALKDHLVLFATEDEVLTADGHLRIVSGNGTPDAGATPAA